MDKKIAFLAVSIGSLIGGYVPVLFGVDVLSAWSIITSGVGALVALWLAWRYLG